MGHTRNYSEETAAAVDVEIKNLLGQAHQEAFEILERNRDVLDTLVLALLDKETLDKAEIAAIFEALTMNPARPAWTGSPERVPSSIPPVDIPQEIRDRVHAGAVAQEEETRGGGAILTPPGPGGDVHGGPEAHPDTPTPPSPDAP
jgi:cell division protease FtsH